jgi:CheY-like chemotaxis protein
MKTILVVDDEADIRRFLELVLKEAGYDPFSASSGAEALVQAGTRRPNLILLDVMMPEMDGWEVLAALRSDPRTDKVPVVMISARTDGTGDEQWRTRGATAFVAKPFHLRPLLRQVEEIFSATAAARPAEA